jgi:Ca-activated chloride channel family protein
MKVRILCLSGIVASLFLQVFAQDQIPRADEPLRVRVDMVSLPVVVTDRTGKRITGLTKNDFEVFENGVRQEIAGFEATDEPVNVALLLDTSGSTEMKLARIQNAAISFVNQLHPDDEVAVLSFADEVKLQQDFTIDRDRNEYGIKKTRTGEWTVLYEAVWLALEEVLKPIRERKALVIFSDGVDTKSRYASMNETLDLAKETGATIYCVYFNTEFDQYTRNSKSILGGTLPPVIMSPYPPITTGPGPGTSSYDYNAGKRYLEALADNSGGLLFDGMQNLDYAFSEVAKELASQYSIGYYSTDEKRDGKFRKVQVKMTEGGLVARTKKGYYTKKEKSK